MRVLLPSTETTATGCSERENDWVSKSRSAEAIVTLISLKRSLTSLLAAETPEAYLLTFASRFVVFNEMFCRQR